MIEFVEAILRDPKWAPYYGWHDDHRGKEQTADYKPAMQQVKAEFIQFVNDAHAWMPMGDGNALQLGMGECDASHEVWRTLFGHCTTIDWRVVAKDAARWVGDRVDTKSDRAKKASASFGPYDLLFIDAGHDYHSVRDDHRAYFTMVKPGGIIAFHDALERPGYPEVKVHEYLRELSQFGYRIELVGSEVGIAWYRTQ